MAEEEEKAEGAEPTEGEEPRKSKKGLLLGGGAAVVVAVAAIVSMVAVPGTDEVPSFGGPFVADIVELEAGESLTANLAGEGGRRYLALDLKVEYDAYEETYGAARIADPLYKARLQDTLLTIASQHSAEEVLQRGTQELFLTELRLAVEPLLFPIHVGKSKTASGADEESGLRPGLAVAESTMRTPYHDGRLAIDAQKGTIRFNEGEEYTFKGSEENLVVKDENGHSLFLDVTGLKEEFVGEVKVGVKGRIREIYKVKFIIQ